MITNRMTQSFKISRLNFVLMLWIGFVPTLKLLQLDFCMFQLSVDCNSTSTLALVTWGRRMSPLVLEYDCLIIFLILLKPNYLGPSTRWICECPSAIVKLRLRSGSLSGSLRLSQALSGSYSVTLTLWPEPGANIKFGLSPPPPPPPTHQ